MIVFSEKVRKSVLIFIELHFKKSWSSLLGGKITFRRRLFRKSKFRLARNNVLSV